MKKIENQLKAMNSGKGQYNKALVIPSAAEWQEIKNGMDMKTIQEVSTYCDSLVYSAFEIPPHFWVQSAEHEPKYANMEAALNTFRQGPINSAWLDIKDVANEILSAMGLSDKYEFKYALKYESTRADMLADVQNGILTRTEYRDRVSYDADEDNSEILEQYSVLNTTVALQHALNNAPVVVPTKPEAGAGPGNAANKPNTVPMGGDAKVPGESKLMAGGPGSGPHPGGGTATLPAPAESWMRQHLDRREHLIEALKKGVITPELAEALDAADNAAQGAIIHGKPLEPGRTINEKIDRSETGWRTKAAGGFKSQPVRGPITKAQGEAIAADVRRLTVATATHHAATTKSKIKAALKAQHDRIKSKLLTLGARWLSLTKQGETKKAAGTPRKEIKAILPDVFNDDSENSSMGDTFGQCLRSGYA